MRVKNQRLSSEDLSLIRKLTDEGKSLNYLSRLMNLDKTTIYYQVRKFKPRIKKDFIVNLNDFQIGELIGAFAGDGNYYYSLNDKKDLKKGGQHKVRYYLTFSSEKDYAKYLFNLLKNLNLNPHIQNRDNSVLVVAVSSKSFINFIRSYLIWEKDKTFTIRLRKDISEYSNNFLRGFARGLMDADGFLNPSNAVCACISKGLINDLDRIFQKFGLKTTRTVVDKIGRRTLYFVRVRSLSLSDFNKIIGFSSKHKIESINKMLDRRKD